MQQTDKVLTFHPNTPQKVTVYGAGYVGLVTATCLADIGHDVVCIDIDKQKIAQLTKGISPIFEPELSELLIKNLKNKNLRFDHDTTQGVHHGFYQFIAVATPSDENGAADLQYVFNVAETIAQNRNENCLIVNKSTVPVGTAHAVYQHMKKIFSKRNIAPKFSVVSNPEFLREGSAIEDFMKPDRIIIGTADSTAAEAMLNLYAPLSLHSEQLIVMDTPSAELTKYAANAFLATKISFMNELSYLAERFNANIHEIRKGIGSDKRIGPHFIYAGCGYGGSCFPKDVSALISTAAQVDCNPRLLKAVQDINYYQKQILFKKIHKFFQGNLKNKTFALWGLAFKPNTDDMREAPSLVLMDALWKAGATVQAYDPEAMENTHKICGDRKDLILCKDWQSTLNNADALVVITEWKIFQQPDLPYLKTHLKQPVIFDGRNLYNPEQMKQAGFEYFGIGYGQPLIVNQE